MDVRGSHGRPPVPDHDAIELRSRGGPSTSAAGAVDRNAAARNEEIGRIAHVLESESKGGSEFRVTLRDKAAILHDEMNQTADNVRDVIKTAKQCDTKTSALAEGAIGLTYALSGIPGDLIGKGIASAMKLEPGTPAHEFVSGVAGGMTAVAFKAVLSRVIGNSIKDSKWMQADMDALEPFMQEVAKKRDTLGHRLKQAALGGTGYDLRNPITGGVSTGTQMLDENAPRATPRGILEGARQAGYLGNQATGLALTIGAGAFSGVAQNHFDHLHGAEFLFGRHDWQERYMALASGSTHSGEGNRLNAVWQHATAPKSWVEGVTVLSALSAIATEVAEGLGLGSGLGVANMAKGGAGRSFTSDMAHGTASAAELAKNPSFRAIREGVSQMAYIPVAAGAYFEQGLFGNLYKEVERAVQNKLRPHAEIESSSSSSTSTTTEDEDSVSSGARTPAGSLPHSEAPSVGDPARTPSDSPPRSEAPSVGDPARTPSDSPPRSEAPSVGDLARTPSDSPPRSEAPSVGVRAKTPSETSESDSIDSASIRSHLSGPLRNTPPPRSEEMRAQGDTHPWWTDFKDSGKTEPRPLDIPPEEIKALEEHIATKAKEMREHIAEMIPLPASEPTSSAPSVASEPAEQPAPKKEA